MDRINTLISRYPHIPWQVLLKCDILFEGLRYTPQLKNLCPPFLRGFRPYHPHVDEQEEKPLFLPYFMVLSDRSLVLMRYSRESKYTVKPAERTGYFSLEYDGETLCEVTFQHEPEWYKDAFIKKKTSIYSLSQHGDMLVWNVAPECEYWSDCRADGRSHRCVFCGYGGASERSRILHQIAGEPQIDRKVIDDVMASCSIAAHHQVANNGDFNVRHIYMVGGSMLDTSKEGERYLIATRALKKIDANWKIGCGSQALSAQSCEKLKEAGVDYVCFNIEVWEPEIWKQACPGKAKYIGWDEWIKRLENAVKIFGRGAVLSAFVTGIEYGEPLGFKTVEQAIASSLEGARWMLDNGIFAIFSPFSPVPGSDYEKFAGPSKDYFITLAFEYWKLRNAYGMKMPEELVCRHCMYAQIENDMDVYARI